MSYYSNSEQSQCAASYLAQLVHSINAAPLSDDIRLLVRQHILDACASAFIGCRRGAFSALTQVFPTATPGVPWPGCGSFRTDRFHAVLAWAFAVNASVSEDGSREGACHPAAAIFPITIALSERATWDQLDRAVVAGYDVMVRMARCGNPAFTAKGFHPTSITAPFGAAATASLLIGLDIRSTQHALSLAALGSSGLMASFKCGRTQPLQVALAVKNGMTAALLAREGQEGYPAIIDEGFYPAYLGIKPSPPLDAPLHHQYAIMGSYLKPYPGCRHLHPSIDAFGMIMDKNKLNPEKIVKIQVRTYKTAVETEIHRVTSREDAYFNIPYALSVRALLGRCDYDAFDEKYFTDEKIIALARKVEVGISHEIDSLYPDQRGSMVEVSTTDGAVIFAEVSHPYGEPENPIPEKAVRDKFRTAARDYLTDEAMTRVESLLDTSNPEESPQCLFSCLGKNSKTA